MDLELWIMNVDHDWITDYGFGIMNLIVGEKITTVNYYC